MRIRVHIIITFLALLALPALESCKKYPDGPKLSLRTRRERVANEWRMESYIINGRDYTSQVAAYSESYTKNDGYAYWWGNASASGTWQFVNRDEEIQLIGFDKHSSRRLYILRLEEKTFWYYWMDGSDRHEFHLVEK